MQPYSSSSFIKSESTPRISLRLDGRLLGKIDNLVGKGKFASRSEFIRKAIIEMLVRYDTELASGQT